MRSDLCSEPEPSSFAHSALLANSLLMSSGASRGCTTKGNVSRWPAHLGLSESLLAEVAVGDQLLLDHMCGALGGVVQHCPLLLEEAPGMRERQDGSLQLWEFVGVSWLALLLQLSDPMLLQAQCGTVTPRS